MKKVLLFSILCIASATTYAQIPNSGFETWMNMGSYDMPDSWDQLNGMTASASTYTCTMGTPGNPGSSYIKLTSKSVSGMGVMPGIATCGVLDMSNMMDIKPAKGFPYTSRPGQLTGNWQYMAYGSDQGYISVLLTKWNTSMGMRDTVAYTMQMLSGMVMSWASFSINLNYMSTSAPDSAIIVLSSSGAIPVANSYLYVDNLAFSGSPAAVNNVSKLVNTILLSPNPAKNMATLQFTAANAKPVDVALITLSGKIIWSSHLQANAGENSVPINVSNLAKGIYMVSVNDGSSSTIERLVIQ